MWDVTCGTWLAWTVGHERGKLSHSFLLSLFFCCLTSFSCKTNATLFVLLAWWDETPAGCLIPYVWCAPRLELSLVLSDPVPGRVRTHEAWTLRFACISLFVLLSTSIAPFPQCMERPAPCRLSSPPKAEGEWVHRPCRHTRFYSPSPRKSLNKASNEPCDCIVFPYHLRYRFCCARRAIDLDALESFLSPL